MKIDKQTLVKKQIAALDALDRSALRQKFESLYGFTVHEMCNTKMLKSRIAYRLQEFQFGGLSQEAKKLLDDLADTDALASLIRLPRKKYSTVRGARFVRFWHDKEYNVIALGKDKFEYEGKIYKSLTAIASLITGTHQSGRRFFGVNL